MNIYLIGPMGSGKSAAARALSRRLRWPLIDTDRAVEARAGASIPRIFRSRGESFFRRLEREALARAAGRPGRVVAVGGGAVLAPANVAAMKRTGVVVYLQASRAACLRRVQREGVARRPLLALHPPRRRANAFKRLLQTRVPLYIRASAVRVRGGAVDPATLAARIARRLGPWLRGKRP